MLICIRLRDANLGTDTVTRSLALYSAACYLNPTEFATAYLLPLFGGELSAHGIRLLPHVASYGSLDITPLTGRLWSVPFANKFYSVLPGKLG